MLCDERCAFVGNVTCGIAATLGLDWHRVRADADGLFLFQHPRLEHLPRAALV